MGDCVVESHGAMHTNAQLLPGEHVAFEHANGVSRGLEPSYDSAYLEVHKADFERLRSLVQTPEPGNFMHKDLTWTIQNRAKGRWDGPRSHVPISVAYIPWARVLDFVKGEEARIDGPCKFVCQGTPSNQRGKITFPRWNSYSTVIRCVCNIYSEFHYASFHVTDLFLFYVPI